MKTLKEKLSYLAETKAVIKDALVEQGQTVTDSDSFRSYADKIKAIDKPTLITDAELELDFSGGDMPISAPDGYAFTGGTIKKPETLVPENIAKDVEVAGIVGTHEGGGGGNQPQLYAPTLTRSGTTVTIANPTNNGIFASSYKIYDGENLISEQTAKTLNIGDFELGEHILTARACGENFIDSNAGAELNASRYSITKNLTNITTVNEVETVFHGDSLSMIFSVSEGYVLPSKITVTNGGIVANTTYSQLTGELTISNIKGDVEITAAGAIPGLATDSWELIAERANAGTISNYYSIGEEKELELNYADGTSEKITMVLAGFEVDGLTINNNRVYRAASFISKELLATSRPVDSTATAYKPWTDSELRSWLNSELLGAMPTALQENIKPVRKVAPLNTNGAGTGSEKGIWIPAPKELGCSIPNNYLSGYNLGSRTYPLYTNDSSLLVKYKVGSETAEKWFVGGMNKYGAHLAILPTGGLGTAQVYTPLGICFGFSL